MRLRGLLLPLLLVLPCAAGERSWEIKATVAKMDLLIARGDEFAKRGRFADADKVYAEAVWEFERLTRILDGNPDFFSKHIEPRRAMS